MLNKALSLLQALTLVTMSAAQATVSATVSATMSATVSAAVISDADAVALVAAQEQAREAARDAKEVELQSADIIETAVADLGHKRVVFNRVATAPSVPSAPSAPSDLETIPAEPAALAEQFTEEELLAHLAAESKPLLPIKLSGEVDEHGISELWWTHENMRYRIFTNADFLLFSGLGSFEDASHRYSLFLMVTERTGALSAAPSGESWRPTTEDFAPDALEYYIMEWGDVSIPEEAAFAGVEAMLAHYSEHSADMRAAYENRLKIQSARAGYLEANPPKADRDVIINFRPTGKSAGLYE